MSKPSQDQVPEGEQQRDELLRRALATRPISNEEILKRSKEQPRKRKR